MATMFFSLLCLERDATRTLEMRLLGRGLCQRCLVLGPAEHEAENVTQTWWAGGDIQLHGHHRESGNACWARSVFSADFGGAGVSLAKATSGGPWQHRGGREAARGSRGEVLLGLSGAWVSCQCRRVCMFDQIALWCFLLDWPENV